MTWAEAVEIIEEKYGVKAQFLWADLPNFAVFRHSVGKKKWFALAMNGLENAKFGRKIPGVSDVLNLKIDPELGAILRDEKAIFRAYHMNKTHWISVCLDALPDQEIAD